MTAPKILVFAASLRPGSFNGKLADIAAGALEGQGAAVTRLALSDYPLPLYEAQLEAAGIPDAVLTLHGQFSAHDGVFIASPEYNSSVTPLLKNTLDWVTRVRAKGESGLEVFKTRVFAISGASPGYYGTMRGLLHLRQILAVGMGATVIPQQIALPRATHAFEADGSLKDEAQQNLCKSVVEALAVAARKFA